MFAAPHSQGWHAGNVYRYLPETVSLFGRDVAALTYLTGLSASQLRVELDKLVRTEMALPQPAGWVHSRANPVAITIHLDVAGYLEDRAQRYRYEREQWGFWMAEVDEILKRRRRRGARPGFDRG